MTESCYFFLDLVRFTTHGAFLKTQRHNFKGHKNTNLCLFNPIFNPIICLSVIKTQICTTSPPRCANLCPDISLTYFYFPRENFIFRLDVTPAARRLRTSSHAAATTAFVARCLSPPPPPPAPLPHTTAARRTPQPPSRTPSLTTTVRPWFRRVDVYLIFLYMCCVH